MLKDINLVIEDGEFMTLLGPSEKAVGDAWRINFMLDCVGACLALKGGSGTGIPFLSCGSGRSLVFQAGRRVGKWESGYKGKQV